VWCPFEHGRSFPRQQLPLQTAFPNHETDAMESESSSSSDEDDVVAAVMVLAPYLRARYACEPYHDSELTGAMYYEELCNSRNRNRFYEAARMRLTTFESLLLALEATGLLRSTDHICGGEKLLMFIDVLTCTTTRRVAERWQHSTSTVSNVVTEVSSALLAIESTVVVPPERKTPAQISTSLSFAILATKLVVTATFCSVPE
jgi:hypothetical protein